MTHCRKQAALGRRVTAVAALVLACSPATAQTPAEPSAAIGLEEIIVTAQRRDQSLAKAPVAVSVLTAEALARTQIVSEEDLRSAVAGLSVRTGLGSNQLNYSLRGQSRDAYSGTRPGVLPYINEVQIGGAGGSTAFYDLQSVQVLKGPQGTLFGRSATGGAVLFTTARPTEELSGYVSVLGGDYGSRKLEGAISGPLGGGANLVRLAGFYQERDGFQHNLYNGETEGDLERWGGRLSVTTRFGERARNELVYDYYQSDGESTIGVVGGLLPFVGGGAGNPPFIPIEYLYSGTLTPLARGTGIGTLQAFVPPEFAPAAPGFYDAYFADPRRSSAGIRAVLEEQQRRGPYVVESDARNLFESRNSIVTNVTTIELSDVLTLKNVLGFVDLDSTLSTDSDGTAYNIVSTVDAVAYNRQFSEELQLIGNLRDDRLQLVTGLYYSDEKYRFSQRGEFFDLIFGGQFQINAFELKNRTLAAYAQGTHRLGDGGWSATLGARYTSEDVRKIQLPEDSIRLVLGPNPPAGYEYDQSRTYNRLSWQVGVQNEVTDSLLLYAVARRAFKSGGYNGFLAPLVGSAEIAGDGYDAERVTDAELGVKFQGDLGTVPSRMNLAVYHNWIADSQRTGFSLVLGNPAALTVNVPKGKIWGVEFDGQFKLTDRLTVGGTANYTDATFSADTVFINGSGQQYDRVPDTPETSGTLFAELSFPLGSAYALSLRGDVYSQSKTVTNPRSQNSQGTLLPSYTISNLRLALDNRDAGWSLAALVKNVADEVYYTGGLPTGEIYQINVLVPGEPRTFAIEARYTF
ncbi:MAG: TonB-dependent receptor [Steroidobacteraceae bacterium]|nr:TonB-dependent receptor [Nevskiaceae bacterium]MCP5359797.1 TonB-dependent receptor [Nevskiaceae bacterium]MCP5467406.1 TonB-dependent receptor [Nevskiaceae bacterium]MCP5472713.1 TonB-dependent receptor [Nevskiaceae bacterium]